MQKKPRCFKRQRLNAYCWFDGEKLGGPTRIELDAFVPFTIKDIGKAEKFHEWLGKAIEWLKEHKNEEA